MDNCILKDIKPCGIKEVKKLLFVIFVGSVFLLGILFHYQMDYSSMWTTSDLKSPFFGMFHRDTAGSVNPSETKLYQFTEDVWKNFFPQLFTAIKIYRSKNPKQEKKLFTNSFSIQSSKSTFNFGQVLIATIVSIDAEGALKTFGGDFYRARLIRNDENHSDGIPCKVTDNNDGSYTVKSPVILLEGLLTLEVTLVFTCEGLDELTQKTDALYSWGHQYFAQLKTNEKVPCNVNLSLFSDLEGLPVCDYSNPRNNEPWFCVKPLSGNCTKIAFLAYGGPARGSSIDIADICSRNGCAKKRSQLISVVRKADKQPTKINLRPCHDQFWQPMTFNVSTGYFKNSQWNSILCNGLKSFSNLEACLNNKVLFFIGDSTIRQFFYLAVQKLSLHVEGPDNSIIWQQPKVAYSTNHQTHKTTIFYRAHGPPLQNPGPPETRPYISDTISDLPVGGDQVYVIFNIGAHLVNYNANIFFHRLQGIKNAIVEHQKVFPNTKFILKGLNVVNMHVEWFFYRYEILLRSVFKDMNNVLFLNLWDASTVWTLDDYHPDKEMLEQQALMMFSYVCPQK